MVQAHAGVDLEMMGEARTYLNTAIAEGLRSAGVTYTLPPIFRRPGDPPGGGGPETNDVEQEMHLRDANLFVQEKAAQASGAPARHSSGNDFADTAARVAAAETVLMMS